MALRTDETGLHAVDCDCVVCDAGNRPTELERAAARRALARGLAIVAKAQAKDERRPVFRRAAELPPLRVPPPWTPEERAEADRLREAFKRGKAS
jgi:hypothetical protein